MRRESVQLTDRNKTQTRAGGGQGVRGWWTHLGLGVWISFPFLLSCYLQPATEVPKCSLATLGYDSSPSQGNQALPYQLYIHYYVHDTRAYLVGSNERILFHLAQEHHQE